LPKNGNNAEATFDFVERIVRLVAFDNVSSTSLLAWTGLYNVRPIGLLVNKIITESKVIAYRKRQENYK